MESALPGIVEAAPADSGDGVVPDGLRCVSNAIDGGGAVPMVLRVTIAVDAAGAGTVTMVGGPQFHAHGGTGWEGDLAGVDEREVHRAADGALVAETVLGGLRVELAREGAVVRGKLVDDQCYVHTEVDLTCWNDLALFGSPWAGLPGLLDARLDWATGACRDSEGMPALNDTPIEVVRETGNGECADLRGAALDGDDLAGADLAGWNLAGAQLDGARLSFGALRYASLQGADLSTLDLGDGTVDGSIDEHTLLPREGCAVDVSPWAGNSVTCTSTGL